MFCPECGNPLSDGQRFCPKCGTPVEGIGQPAGEDAAAGSNGQSADTGVGAESAGQSVNTGAGAVNSGQPEDAGFSAGSAENARQSAGNSGFGAGNTQNMGNTAGSSYGQQAQTGGGSAGGAKGGNLDMVMRIACGVFAVFFLISALTRIPGIFSTIFNLRIVYFISTILGFAAAIVMTLSTAASAWKWSSKLKDLVFGGAVLGVLLRLLSLIISLVANLITFGGFVGGKSIFYWLGYVFVAAALFGLMYAMGCAPVIGETKEELQNNISAGFSELSGAAKDLQKKQAEKSAAKQSAAYQAPPAGGAGYQTPPVGGAGYQADPAGYQTPPAGGVPGYGVPPMGGVGYGMPTGPARGTVAKKTDRSIWIYILLSLVTCSIYPYFFIHKLAEDVNDICEGDGESTSGILAFIFLGFITCGIYRIIWWYKLANRLQANGPRYNVPIQENGTTYVMWVLFGSLLCFIGPFIALNFVIKNTNKLCTVYNQYNGLR